MWYFLLLLQEESKMLQICDVFSKIFRQILPFLTLVDKVINNIPIESFVFYLFMNNLPTSYPLDDVDK